MRLVKTLRAAAAAAEKEAALDVVAEPTRRLRLLRLAEILRAEANSQEREVA